MNKIEMKQLSDIFAENLRKEIKRLSSKHKVYIYEELLIALFLHDVTHVSCFKKIRNEKIMNMDFEGVKKFHKFKFKLLAQKISNLHLDNVELDGVSEIELERKKDNLIKKQEEFLFSLSKLSEKFSLRELVEMHRYVIMSIIEKDFNYGNKDEFLEIKKTIEKEFLSVFGRHYRMLECAKENRD